MFTMFSNALNLSIKALEFQLENQQLQIKHQQLQDKIAILIHRYEINNPQNVPENADWLVSELRQLIN